ncbi:hypothetical protein HOLleu_30498 [Holothuria leucospilota]|uniref:Uncharacterized protein n=1 Tax=Holothuria leucospilota TaxID=206669 RepID=A0A9Q1BKI8_HOLLE|nr:hypothetical protein HOLleu_30498 [Holothuria leucospilota]
MESISRLTLARRNSHQWRSLGDCTQGYTVLDYIWTRKIANTMKQRSSRTLAYFSGMSFRSNGRVRSQNFVV